MRRRGDRGQTTLDFAVGMSTFLVAVAFVMAFVPGMLQPFVGGAQEETVAADRTASDLSGGLLVDTDDPHLLNATCTEAFFDRSSPGGCGFDGEWGDGDTNYLNDAVGIRPPAALNVTVRNESGVVRIDGTLLRAGQSVPRRHTGVVVAQRIVRVEGDTARLYVRVW